MPKQTFYNLPEEKRDMIERCALEEFSEYGFDASNINRIVANSSIAKGSFYQYFEDKKDLLFHTLAMLVEQKMAMIKPVLDRCGQNSFTQNLEEMFRVGIAFADSDPLLWRFSQKFSGGAMQDILIEFAKAYQPMTVDVFGVLLTQAKQREELREDVEIPIVSAMISSLISQSTVMVVEQMRNVETREQFTRQLLNFIERAVLR